MNALQTRTREPSKRKERGREVEIRVESECSSERERMDDARYAKCWSGGWEKVDGKEACAMKAKTTGLGRD